MSHDHQVDTSVSLAYEAGLLGESDRQEPPVRDSAAGEGFRILL